MPVKVESCSRGLRATLLPTKSSRAKLDWMEGDGTREGEKSVEIFSSQSSNKGIFPFPRYCDKFGLKTALHKVTAKQFQANIPGKNKSSSAISAPVIHPHRSQVAVFAQKKFIKNAQ